MTGGRATPSEVCGDWTQPDTLTAYLTETMYCPRSAAGGGSETERTAGMKRKIEEPTPM